jgi:hypothetical protein
MSTAGRDFLIEISSFLFAETSYHKMEANTMDEKEIIFIDEETLTPEEWEVLTDEETQRQR